MAKAELESRSDAFRAAESSLIIVRESGAAPPCPIPLSGMYVVDRRAARIVFIFDCSNEPPRDNRASSSF